MIDILKKIIPNFKNDFSGVYPLNEKSYLLATTDGVGTKVRLAINNDQHERVAEDLVNHCVNDIIVCGGEPKLFLDYLAFNAIDDKIFERILKSIRKACSKYGVTLLGGETAQMGDFYKKNEYDVCGTMIGFVDKENFIDGSTVKEGDLIIGLPSNGLHTNGYTMARKLLTVDGFQFSEDHAKLLLQPHICYKNIVDKIKSKIKIKSMAHITGGGFMNLGRTLPKNVATKLYYSWPIPEIFKILQQKAQELKMDVNFYSEFNMGIGMTLVIDPKDLRELRRAARKSEVIGEIITCPK
jgi:phosphoribosylformylglycinamidine cyclo-ligase